MCRTASSSSWAEQQVHGLVRIEAGQQCFVLFFEAFEMDRPDIPQCFAGIARGVEPIHGVGSGFPVTVVLEIRDDDVACATPSRASAEPLHQAWPWRKLGDSEGTPRCPRRLRPPAWKR